MICLSFVEMINTAFLIAVCQGLRPNISGCSDEMKALLSVCWDANPHSRPCLYFSSSHFYPCKCLLFIVFIE